MIKKKLAFIILLMFSICAQAQEDSSLVKEARTALQEKRANVSSILTDKKYLPVHPLTVFRDLIKAHAATGVVQIAIPDEPGRKIRVRGLVKNKDGQPVAGAMVYLYQTDHKGWYAADAPHVQRQEADMRHARLFGYVITDHEGKFELHTIKPAGYPQSDLPAHIHVHIWAPGYRNFVNEFLFDDDERLVGSIREQSERNHFLIEKPVKGTDGFDQQFSYLVVLDK